MIKGVKQLCILLLLLIGLVTALDYWVLAATKPPAQGGALPQSYLDVPEDLGARSYLGLSGAGKFTISQIEAKAVVVQIFSRY